MTLVAVLSTQLWHREFIGDPRCDRGRANAPAGQARTTSTPELGSKGVTSDDVRRGVRNFIEDSFLYMHPDVELADDEPLLDRGLIDSLGFVELVEEVQARYGIQVRGHGDH